MTGSTQHKYLIDYLLSDDPFEDPEIFKDENGRIYFDGATSDLVTVVIRMVAYGSNTMSEELMMPKDMEEQVIEIVLKKLLGERNIPQDKVLDGVDSINR